MLFTDINVEQALQDPNSVFYYYKRLLTLRKEHPVMIYGDFTDYLPHHEQIYLYTRTLHDVTWLIMLNNSDENSVIPEQWQQSSTALLSNYDDVQTHLLRPHEARIYQL
ncbi:DUF3459 domain-containing protein [Ectobacillus sp. JY-23]|uniref:alpha-amylase family glycosyl hydrolase n=1 Tax=Ectobacillus sp. JY-23 TaxID=2933872 RepID=UPI001FF26249|nr:DUF3459 domain-containing protein [Ectobacillus sp. JY-23]UOY92771.1 DUF3459 domain-containing protein [Ectobacillus sp. JY-23]